MCATCSYFLRMDKLILLGRVPDALHGKLKARAAVEGLFLSDYLLRKVRRIAERPTVNEFTARLAHERRLLHVNHPHVQCGLSATQGDCRRRQVRAT